MTPCDYTPESHNFYVYYSVNLKSHCLLCPVTPVVYSFPVVQQYTTQAIDKVSLNKLSVLTDKFLFIRLNWYWGWCIQGYGTSKLFFTCSILTLSQTKYSFYKYLDMEPSKLFFTCSILTLSQTKYSLYKYLQYALTFKNLSLSFHNFFQLNSATAPLITNVTFVPLKRCDLKCSVSLIITSIMLPLCPALILSLAWSSSKITIHCIA